MKTPWGAAWSAVVIAVGTSVVAGAAEKAKEPAPLVKTVEFTLQEPRTAAAVVAKDNYLYVIGGGNRATAILDSIERVNVRSGKAEPFARLRVGRSMHGAVIVGNQIYVLGGVRTFGERKDIEDSVEIVDLATGAVSAGPKMPLPRYAFGCVEVAGKIHVIGGWLKKGLEARITNTCDVLDVASGQWTAGVPMGVSRECAAAVVPGGFIIVAGGFNGQRKVTDVEVFGIQSQAWRTLPPLQRAVSAHSVVFGGKALFLLGDYEDRGALQVYDLGSKQAKSYRIDERVARHSAGVLLAGRIYEVGGLASSELDASNWVIGFDPVAP